MIKQTLLQAYKPVYLLVTGLKTRSTAATTMQYYCG